MLRLKASSSRVSDEHGQAARSQGRGEKCGSPVSAQPSGFSGLLRAPELGSSRLHVAVAGF